MKKLFYIVALSLACVANADVLNWQVNTGDSTSTEGYARLYANTTKSTSGGTALASTDLDEGVSDPIEIDVSTYSSSSTYFYIELGNLVDATWTASGKVMGAYSYSDLVAAGMITSGGLSPATASAFGVNGALIGGAAASYAGAVPEPTSALLLLLGTALVGLKRRRA